MFTTRPGWDFFVRTVGGRTVMADDDGTLCITTGHVDQAFETEAVAIQAAKATFAGTGQHCHVLHQVMCFTTVEE